MKNDINSVFNYLTSDVEDLGNKRWLIPAIKSHLRKFGFSEVEIREHLKTKIK